MKTLFNFSKGEWSAALFLLILSVGSILFYHLYGNYRKPQILRCNYEEQIIAFEMEQQRLSDSIEQVRKERASQWQNRKYDYTYSPPDSNSYYYPARQDTTPFKKRVGYAIVKVQLNNCDTADITRIPQFGSKRALKVVEYREQLGGYYALEQLKEIYILQNMDTSFLSKYFEIDANLIHKININSATYKELIRHPYFDAYLTKCILNYRQQNGAIKDIEDLQRITHAYDELIRKIAPYLEWD